LVKKEIKETITNKEAQQKTEIKTKK
jgi:hypothetical protein